MYCSYPIPVPLQTTYEYSKVKDLEPHKQVKYLQRKLCNMYAFLSLYFYSYFSVIHCLKGCLFLKFRNGSEGISHHLPIPDPISKLYMLLGVAFSHSEVILSSPQ